MRILPLLTVIMTATPVLAAQDAAPTAFPLSRYEKMMGKSPFAVATPVVAPEAPKDSFTKDWVVTSINKLPQDSQGIALDFVTIMTRDQTQRFTLMGNEPNNDGVAIASVEHSPLKGQSKVTLKKGEEYGTVKYDEMLMQAQPPSASIGQRPGMPPGAQMAPGNQGLNINKQPMGGNRAIIPRPNLPAPGGKVPQMNNNGAAPLPGVQQPAPGDARRRVRVINSKP